MKRGILTLRIVQPAQNVRDSLKAQLYTKPVQGKEVVDCFWIGGHGSQGTGQEGPRGRKSSVNDNYNACLSPFEGYIIVKAVEASRGKREPDLSDVMLKRKKPLPHNV
jgi:hypothetical protein